MYTAKGKSIRVLTVLGIIAGLAGLVAYYASPGAETRPNPAEQSMMTNAAIARIAAEGQGTLREPPIQAAPRSSEALGGFDGTVNNSRPSPPGGYSFASYHGEMLRAQIEGGIDAGGEAPVRILTGLGRPPPLGCWSRKRLWPDVTGPSAGYGSQRTQHRMTWRGRSKARVPRSSVQRGR